MEIPTGHRSDEARKCLEIGQKLSCCERVCREQDSFAEGRKSVNLLVNFDDLAVVNELNVRAEAQDGVQRRVFCGEGEVGVAIEFNAIRRGVVVCLLDLIIDPLRAVLVEGAAGDEAVGLLFDDIGRGDGRRR